MNPRVLIVAGGVLLAGAAALWWSTRNRPDDSAPAPEPADNPARQEQLARDLVGRNPQDAQARFQLAQALRRLGRVREAEHELDRAVQLGFPEKAAQREAVLLAASQNWRKELEGLVHWYVRENPDDAEVQLAVADFFAANGRWEQSIPLFTRAIKHDPGQTELYFKRGVARMRANYSGAAVEDFRRVLAADAKRYEARFFLGNCLLGDARIDEAERELVVCSHERPDDIEPRVSLAACALERNDLAKAESLLLEALKRDGNSPLVLQELGSLYLRQQRHEMAMAALRKLVAIDREHRHGHLMLAQALLAAGDLGEARKHEQIYKELDRKEEERLAARRGMR